MKITVLGAGMIGRTIAKDLAVQHQVTAVDRDAKSLQQLSQCKNIQTQQIVLNSSAQYAKLLKGQDLCICAVPGFMGYDTLENIIRTGTNVVDISFSPESTAPLHELAVQHGVTAITDCGVAPGLSNIILGYENTQMDVSHFLCQVGGLPKERIPPFEYKAPFSPIDVIEEYSRPARFVEHGALVVKDALSDAETINFPTAGDLESFNTDGLRSLISSFPHIPNMKEKTLRYPGHIKLIKDLQLAGFFDPEKMMVDGAAISRKDFTCKILFDQWKLLPGDEEFTLMQIDLAGINDKSPVTKRYFLYDEYDKSSNTSSMSRTTAFTCTAAAELVLNGMFNTLGVHAPEAVGARSDCYDFVMNYLKERNINIEIAKG